MFAWMLEKWDWMIYGLTYRSLRRIFERNWALAYLFELSIREWRLDHPIPKELEKSTESFFEATKSHKKELN